MAEVKLDFEVLRELGEVAREYGLAGAVQHGASTLPDELFHRFPAVETAEIHLATGFQNALYEHPAFPESLHREIEAWCFANAADERKPGQTDQQFVYTTRKKAIGPFKRQLWELESKDEILAAQRRKISFLFTELGVNGSRDDGRAVHPAGRAPPADPRRAARGRRRGLTACESRARRESGREFDVDGPIAVLSSRAGPSDGLRDPTRIVPRRPRVTPQRTARTRWCGGRRRRTVAGPGSRPGRRGARRRAPASRWGSSRS